MIALPEIRRRALATLVPPPRLALSEWIEGSVNLPEGVSALSGAVRLWPWQREIADAIGKVWRRITDVGGARTEICQPVPRPTPPFAHCAAEPRSRPRDASCPPLRAHGNLRDALELEQVTKAEAIHPRLALKSVLGGRSILAEGRAIEGKYPNP